MIRTDPRDLGPSGCRQEIRWDLKLWDRLEPNPNGPNQPVQTSTTVLTDCSRIAGALKNKKLQLLRMAIQAGLVVLKAVRKALAQSPCKESTGISSVNHQDHTHRETIDLRRFRSSDQCSGYFARFFSSAADLH